MDISPGVSLFRAVRTPKTAISRGAQPQDQQIDDIPGEESIKEPLLHQSGVVFGDQRDQLLSVYAKTKRLSGDMKSVLDERGMVWLALSTLSVIIIECNSRRGDDLAGLYIQTVLSQ